jgi:hypothetical protein
MVVSKIWFWLFTVLFDTSLGMHYSTKALSIIAVDRRKLKDTTCSGQAATIATPHPI